MIFKNNRTSSVTSNQETSATYEPGHRAPNTAKQQSKAAAREKLYDLWTPCLLAYLREEEKHGRPHTLVSLERRFAAYVAKPKGFVQGLIKALVAKGVIQFFFPLPDDNLPKSPSRYGYLRCDGMDWGTDAKSITQTAASPIPSNENAVGVAPSSTQGA